MDEAEGDEGGGEVIEGFKDVDAAFVSHGDASEAGEPIPRLRASSMATRIKSIRSSSAT
jgi:hypothetical protein